MDFQNNSGFDRDVDDNAWNYDQPMDNNFGPQNNSNLKRNAGPNNSKGGGGPQNNFRYRNKRPRNFGPGGGYGGPPRFFGPPPLMGPPGPFGPPGGPPGGPLGGPPGGPPPFIWGRGFGPGGPGGPPVRKPTDNKVLKYLTRCGVAKEHLKNLPRDMLQLIEPEFCGLCGHSFDSFNSSRLHYISKNHLKSQKKWLSQQSDGGYHRAREIPLKSRDLYCELCDVHITSKTHADSHYAGKPHRAIVEGRKNPKNPFLLQRGMNDRVEQLIRREKKHLKPVADENDESQEVAKEAKITPAELYCEICKTSVTCSEQMTMHLNGKKHLAKEKQHILKMMKGEEDDNVEEAPEDEDTAATKSEPKDEEVAETAAAEATPAQEEEWAGQW